MGRRPLLQSSRQNLHRHGPLGRPIPASYESQLRLELHNGSRVICLPGREGTIRSYGGVSLLVIEGDTPVLSRTPIKNMGWRASDTATLHLDNCRVPAGNLLGEEGTGFKTAPAVGKALAEKQGAQAFTNFDAMLDATRPDIVDV